MQLTPRAIIYWGSCSVLTAGNHSTLYPKNVNTLSLLQIIPSQVKVTMFDEVMWTWVSYFPVFLGISRYFPLPWEILLFPGLLTTLGAR